MATVSIVIRALNERSICLRSMPVLRLRPQRAGDAGRFGFTDTSVAISEAAGADIVHIAPEDFSFGRALNVGCEAASGDILVFVSAHVYPVESSGSNG